LVFILTIIKGDALMSLFVDDIEIFSDLQRQGSLSIPKEDSLNIKEAEFLLQLEKNLSYSASFVISFFVDPMEEVVKVFPNINNSNGQYITLSDVRRFLRKDLGWTAHFVQKIFREIKIFLKNRILCYNGNVGKQQTNKGGITMNLKDAIKIVNETLEMNASLKMTKTQFLDFVDKDINEENYGKLPAEFNEWYTEQIKEESETNDNAKVELEKVKEENQQQEEVVVNVIVTPEKKKKKTVKSKKVEKSSKKDVETKKTETKKKQEPDSRGKDFPIGSKVKYVGRKIGFDGKRKVLGYLKAPQTGIFVDLGEGIKKAFTPGSLQITK